MNINRNYTRAALALCALLCLAVNGGCSVYKINIQQGNFLKNEKIDQLKVGMTKRQVQYLLGTPAVQDAFHPDRWDYVFEFRNGRNNQVSKRSMTLFFNGDVVDRIILPDDYVPPAPDEAQG